MTPSDTNVIDDAKRLVECPYCGAAPDVPCHALSWDDHWLYELKRPHRDRVTKWEELRNA